MRCEIWAQPAKLKAAQLQLAGRSLCLQCRVYSVECCGFESHAAQRSDCLGCAVLPCLVVCLILLAPFFLIKHQFSSSPPLGGV